MGPVSLSLGLPAPLMIGITPQSAHLLSLLFTTTYVGSLYLAQTLGLPAYIRSLKKKDSSASDEVQPSASATSDGSIQPEVGSRDHPANIRIRMKAVITATGLSLAGIYWVVKDLGHYSWQQAINPTLSLLGLPSTLAKPTITDFLPYLLAPAILFGPLVAMYLDKELPFQQRTPGVGLLARVKNTWKSWSIIDTRNYIVGPFTEELVFRSTILAASLLGGLSFKSLVFGTPLWFGIAHAHHAWDMYKRNGADRAAAIQAIAMSLFQLTYTTLFGWFASYLFLRTGSILPPLISHIFCNYMGIYLPDTAVERHPKKKMLIWSSYIVGIGAFVAGLRRL